MPSVKQVRFRASCMLSFVTPPKRRRAGGLAAPPSDDRAIAAWSAYDRGCNAPDESKQLLCLCPATYWIGSLIHLVGRTCLKEERFRTAIGERVRADSYGDGTLRFYGKGELTSSLYNISPIRRQCHRACYTPAIGFKQSTFFDLVGVTLLARQCRPRARRSSAVSSLTSPT